MDNWKWTEGGFLKDNDKEHAINIMLEEETTIYRKSNLPIENSYQVIRVIPNEDKLYAFVAYVELNEWKDDDAILYLASECHETPEELIKNHTGVAIESLFMSHSIFNFEIENHKGKGQYSSNYEDFKVTQNDLVCLLDKFSVFKDNRTLQGLRIDIKGSKFEAYSDDNYHLRTYLKIPFNSEEEKGFLHVSSSFDVYEEVEGREYTYAIGEHSDRYTCSDTIAQISKEFGMTPKELKTLIQGYERMQTAIFEAELDAVEEKTVHKTKNEMER